MSPSPITRPLALFAWAMTAAVILLVGLEWNALPDTLPRHFGAGGRPDGWGGKGLLIVFPIIMFASTAALLLPVHFGGIALRMAEKKNVAPEVKAPLAALTQELLASMAVMVGAIHGWIAWGIVDVAMGRREGLGGWFMPVTLSVMAVVIVVHTLRLHRLRRQ